MNLHPLIHRLKRSGVCDRRRAALHEAGHALVFLRLTGMSPRARIFPNPEIHVHEKFWLGHVETWREHRPSGRGLRLFGLAGVVGEHVDDLDGYDDDLMHSMFEAVSETDWAAIGTTFDKVRSEEVSLHDEMDELVELFSNPEFAADHARWARLLIVEAAGRYGGPIPPEEIYRRHRP